MQTLAPPAQGEPRSRRPSHLPYTTWAHTTCRCFIPNLNTSVDSVPGLWSALSQALGNAELMDEKLLCAAGALVAVRVWVGLTARRRVCL
jgi:hypothetical protein